MKECPYINYCKQQIPRKDMVYCLGRDGLWNHEECYDFDQLENLAIEDQVQVTRQRAEAIIDGWLAIYQTQRVPNQEKGELPTQEEGRRMAEEAQKIPELDLADIQALPWKGKRKPDSSYEDAQGKPWGWIFIQDQKYGDAEKQVVARLDEAIRKCKGKLQLGNYEYTYYGDKTISRKEVKA